MFVFLALALATCAAAVLAQQAPPQGPAPQGPPGGGGLMRGPSMVPAMVAIAPPSPMMIERSAEVLGLTGDHKTRLTATLAKGEAALKDLRPKLDAASKALREAVMAPSYDGSKVTELLAKAMQAELAIANSEITTWTEIRAILTPAQVTKLSGLMGRRMGGGTGGGYMGGDRPGGNRPGGNRRGQPGQPPPDAPAPEQ